MANPFPPFQELTSQDFQNYHDALSPTALQDAPGTLFESAFGAMKDLFADRVRGSLKARLPQLAPPDALTEIGTERLMPQGQIEGSIAYAARLQDAWNAWPWAGTALGLLRAFYATGYTNVVLAQVRGGKQFTLDNGGTNLIIWSARPDVSAWSKVNCSITPNATTAPDGTTTAAKIVETNAVSSQHRIEQASSLATGNGLLAVVAKAAERTKIQLRIGSNPGTAIFDLSAGTAPAPPGGWTFGIKSLPNGFYQCWISGPCTAADLVRVNLCDGAGSNTYSGDGTSGAYYWISQVEQNSLSPSAYVPTFTAADSSTLGAGALLTTAPANSIWETDPLSSYSPLNQTLWSKFDVVFPLPLMPPSWTWSGGIPSSSSAEANFIRALIQAWKPAHATCNRIVIVQQGSVWGYPASGTWGETSDVWGGDTETVWTP